MIESTNEVQSICNTHNPLTPHIGEQFTMLSHNTFGEPKNPREKNAQSTRWMDLEASPLTAE